MDSDIMMDDSWTVDICGYMWIFKMLLLSDLHELHGLSSLHLDVLRTSDTLTDAASAVGWVVAVMAATNWADSTWPPKDSKKIEK